MSQHLDFLLTGWFWGPASLLAAIGAYAVGAPFTSGLLAGLGIGHLGLAVHIYRN